MGEPVVGEIDLTLRQSCFVRRQQVERIIVPDIKPGIFRFLGKDVIEQCFADIFGEVARVSFDPFLEFIQHFGMDRV